MASHTNDAARDRMIALCESPAEEAFVHGWFQLAADFLWEAREAPAGSFQFWSTESQDDDLQHVVEPQHRVRLRGSRCLDSLDYRLDFLIIPKPGLRRWWNGYAVEIDGHKWHERTAEDAAYQRRRDRLLIHRARILTIRFAAIEVLKDPAEVAREAEEMIDNAMYEDFCASEFGEPSRPR